ncbi:MAG: cytotoxic translational repressor of toxin-antitoxin stability system [Pseudomonadota bacterium]
MTWAVTVKKKVQKQTKKLPVEIRKVLLSLLREIEIYGPYRSNWLSYGPLGKNRYHCHLKKGKPTYVAVWEIIDKEIRLVEVSYVGTYEKAPY